MNEVTRGRFHGVSIDEEFAMPTNISQFTPISTRRVNAEENSAQKKQGQMGDKSAKHTKTETEAKNAVTKAKFNGLKDAAKAFNKDFKGPNKPIVYGLNGPRRNFVTAIEKQGLPSEQSFLDKLARKQETKKSIIMQNDITNVLWDGLLTPSKYTNDAEIREKLYDADRAIGFKEFLAQHEKYNVAKLPGSQVPDKEYVTLEEGKEREANQRSGWRKTSKGGLEYQLVHLQKPLYFAVDDLIDNIDVVASKKGPDGESVTSTELRWLYRHKDMPEVQENLKFVSAKGPVSHADVFDRPEWDVYKPTNTYK